MNVLLIVAITVLAGALVALVVMVGLVTSRRAERERLREHLTYQHWLGEGLAPPRDRTVTLPQGVGQQAYDAVVDLRARSQV